MLPKMLAALAVATASLFSSQSIAQDEKYPTRPVRVFVPFTAGTISDLLARAFAARLSDRLKQPFVVENRPGGGGVVAGQAVLSAPPDGHVLMFVSSAHAANPSLIKNLPYDTVRDFSGVAMVADSPTVVVARPSLGVRSQAELIAHAKKNPGKLNFSTPGLGSAAHFACELFLSQAGIEMQHIPFKGTEYVTELLSGRVDVACPPVGLAAPHVREGKFVALAVSSRERVKLLPQVPTSAEAGLPQFEYGIWYGLIASAKTPRPILEKLAAEVAAIGGNKDLQESMARQGVAPRSISLAKFDTFIGVEIEKLRGLAKANSLVAE